MRRLLVTGANKGVGLALVSAILQERSDTFVLIGARNPTRGRAAADTLVAGHPDWAERLDVLDLDVSDDASVTAAAAAVADRFGARPEPLYAIVNNAGVGRLAGGLEAVLQVNTFGVRRVCEAFLPLLDANEGRIVNITSASGPSFVGACSPERQRFFCDPRVEWDALASFLDDCVAMDGDAAAFAAAGLSDGDPYGLSKACGNLYTMILARQAPHLRVNACTPGFIETDMTRPYAEAQGKAPTELGMKPPAEGTRSTLHLLFGELEGNGRYYGSDAKRSPLDRYRSPGDPEYTGD